MTRSITILLIILLSSSCTMQKRTHSRGFYAPRTSNVKPKTINNDNNRDLSAIKSDDKIRAVDSNEKSTKINSSKRTNRVNEVVDFNKAREEVHQDTSPIDSAEPEQVETTNRESEEIETVSPEDETHPKLHPLVKKSELLAVVSFLLLFFGIGLIGLIIAMALAHRAKKAIAADHKTHSGTKNANRVFWFCCITLMVIALVIVILLATAGFGMGSGIAIMLF